MKLSLGKNWIIIDMGDMRDPVEAAIKWNLARRLLENWRADNGEVSAEGSRNV